jgi:hypothetical protein
MAKVGKILGLVMGIVLAYDGAVNEWRLLRSVAQQIRGLG